MARLLFHVCIVGALTALTQLGGIAWLLSRLRRRRLAVFAASYLVLSVATVWIAPVFGRVPLPCLGPELQMRSVLFCALNRHYVTPELRATLRDLAADMGRAYPGTVTQVLDANFPYVDGFPLLPHLSHGDGRKADLAFYYRDEKGYFPGATRSPIGYFAFEQGPSDCPAAWPTLRWDMEALQPLWPPLEVEPARTAHALRFLVRDARVDRVFVEPHMQRWLSVSASKLRFQGCRAARHDDHIHVQL